MLQHRTGSPEAQHVLDELFGIGAYIFCEDQIVRFGGHTDPTLPWPEKDHDDKDALEKKLGCSVVGLSSGPEPSKAASFQNRTQNAS